MIGCTTACGAAGARERVVELFAGVGGFRLGLERSGWRTVWANQWEPSTRVQHAFDCYVRSWPDGRVNADIATVADHVPAHDLLVGGFPCQDYSVARTSGQAAGIEGSKGVLWWQIYRSSSAGGRARPPRERRPPVEVPGEPARPRLRDHARLPVGPRLHGRVARRERRRLRLPAAPAPGLPRRDGGSRSGDVDPTSTSSTGGARDARSRSGRSTRGPRLDVPDLDVAGPARSRFAAGRARHSVPEPGVMWTAGLDAQVSHYAAVPHARRRARARRRGPGPFFIPDEQLAQWRYLKGAKRRSGRRATVTATGTRRAASRSPTRPTPRRGRS